MDDRARLLQWMDKTGHTNRTLAEKTGYVFHNISYMTRGDRPVNQAFKWRFRCAFGNAAADEVFCDDVRELA